MKGCPGGSCGISCTDGSCSGSCPSGDSDVRLPPGMLTLYDLEQDTADGVLVFLGDYWGGHDPSGLVASVTNSYDGQILGVVFGGPDLKSEYSRYVSMGLDTLYHIRNPRLVEYSPEGCAAAIVDLWKRVRTASIFFHSSGVGHELASIVAGKLGAGIVDDAVSVRFEGRDAVVDTVACEVSFRGYPQIVVMDTSASHQSTKTSRKGTIINRPYSHPDEIIPLNTSETGNCVFVGESCDAETARLAMDLANVANVPMYEPGKDYGRCLLVCPNEKEYLSMSAARKLCLFEGEPEFELGNGDSAGRLSELTL